MIKVVQVFVTVGGRTENATAEFFPRETDRAARSGFYKNTE
jgi:hypothetical protein